MSRFNTRRNTTAARMPTFARCRLTAASLLLTLVFYVLGGCGFFESAPEALVVYCAHDQLYAERVLNDFEVETGIPVEVRFDTEATKSLGLTELIRQEAANPRCDVFWNNQLLGTADLAQEGLLEPYQGPSWQRIPDGFKDPEGRYVGFGGRLRVWIVNTDQMSSPTLAQVRERMAGEDLSRVALAKPIYGTTLSHVAAWWGAWGGEATQQRLRDWRARGLVVQGGNATVKNLVAQGTCDLGLTDTDDYFVAVDAKQPVAMVVDRVGDDGPTVLIPNTAAIIKGTKRRVWAERLVDYLASEEVERRLAASRSRQIPLGPTDATTLPAEVADLMTHVAGSYPLPQLVDERAAALAWLKEEWRE